MLPNAEDRERLRLVVALTNITFVFHFSSFLDCFTLDLVLSLAQTKQQSRPKNFISVAYKNFKIRRFHLIVNICGESGKGDKTCDQVNKKKDTNLGAAKSKNWFSCSRNKKTVERLMIKLKSVFLLLLVSSVLHVCVCTNDVKFMTLEFG